MEAGTSQLNVLVVDDDEHLRKFLSDLIAREGHQIVAAASAEEALETLPFWTFQVAFLDHTLPGLDGLVLGQYLRRNNPHMIIALVTGDNDANLPAKTRAAGLRFVEKPFEAADILRLLAEYAAAAAERQSARLRASSEHYASPLARYWEELPESFGTPSPPQRIRERLIGTIKRSLNNLRTASRYTERDRAIALSGLITCHVLGVDLPKAAAGHSLFAEYDRLMIAQGRQPEFTPKEDDDK